MNETKIIKSTNFPKCCTKEEYHIRYVDKDKGHIRMVFDDLDLPPGSEIKVCTLQKKHPFLEDLVQYLMKSVSVLVIIVVVVIIGVRYSWSHK